MADQCARLLIVRRERLPTPLRSLPLSSGGSPNVSLSCSWHFSHSNTLRFGRWKAQLSLLEILLQLRHLMVYPVNVVIVVTLHPQYTPQTHILALRERLRNGVPHLFQQAGSKCQTQAQLLGWAR